MYVFCYDPITHAYTGGTPAEYDQRNPGELLVPAWSTKNPPPKHDSAKEWPFYLPAKDAWEVRPLPEPEADPEPVTAEPPQGPEIDALQATLNAHFEAAQRIIDRLKGDGA